VIMGVKLGFRKFLKFWFPLILYSGIIFYVSSRSDLQTPLPATQFDKFIHMLLYCPFGFLAAYAIGQTKPSVSGNVLWGLAVLLSLLYGVSDEFHQSFVPGRYSSWSDVIADTVGGILGGYYFLRVRHQIGIK